MSDYITNSKNRKLKTKILLFLSRINIWAGKLPLSGRIILFMDFILWFSLFLPWFRFVFLNETVQMQSSFSSYSLYIGYSIMLAVILIPFFLLSHTKKERIRSMIPFRLSDTQVIVFIASVLLTTLINLIVVNSIYSIQIAAHGSVLWSGFKVAFSSIISMLIATFYLSKSNKEINTEIYYIDHQTDKDLLDYKDILSTDENKKKKNNMSLPI